MDRLLHRFRNYNADGLTDRELLELLLRFTRSDAREFSSRLMERYPNIFRLMEADRSSLATVEGMDDKTALLLSILPEMSRRYFISRGIKGQPLLNSSHYGKYLLPYFMSVRDEMVYVLFLDGAANLISCRQMGYGSVNSANAPVRNIVMEALALNASGIVLAHNHPSGVAIPSQEDIELTRRLRSSLEIMELELLDHIIIADDDFVSIKDSGYLR